MIDRSIEDDRYLIDVDGLISDNKLGTHRAPAPKKPSKELSPDIAGRNASYAGMTIGEALILVGSRRGESKKEKARLMALMEQPGVTKKSLISDAREKSK